MIMHVCNISFQIIPDIRNIWLHWMKEQFIPNHMELNYFTSYQFYELEVEAEQGPTFTLQLFTDKLSKLETYQKNHASSLLDHLQATWGEQCFHFSSFMHSVD